MTSDRLGVKVWPIVPTRVSVFPRPPPSNESFCRLLTFAFITPTLPQIWWPGLRFQLIFTSY